MNAAEKARRYHAVRLAVRLFNAAEALVFLAWAVVSGAGARVGAAIDSALGSGPLAFTAAVIVWQAALYLLRFPQNFFRSYLHEKRYELSNESRARWLGDEAKGLALSWLFSGAAAAVLWFLVQRGPQPWWPAAAVLSAAAGAFVAFILPHVIVPLFYPLKPLSDAALSARLSAMAARLGVRVRGICEIALSRKTRKANAAVIGLGASRRIVLGDTLIAEFKADEIEAVMAHELGHHVSRHVLWSIAFGAALSAAGLWLLESFSGTLAAASRADSIGSPRAVPALLAAMTAFQSLTGPPQNAFSRRLEREADAFSLKTMGSREAFIGAMRRLASQNLAETRPNPVVEFLFYSHPSIHKRIRFAEEARI